MRRPYADRMRKIGACVLLAQWRCSRRLSSLLNVVIHRSEQNQSECREFILSEWLQIVWLFFHHLQWPWRFALSSVFCWGCCSDRLSQRGYTLRRIQWLYWAATAWSRPCWTPPAPGCFSSTRRGADTVSSTRLHGKRWPETWRVGAFVWPSSCLFTPLRKYNNISVLTLNVLRHSLQAHKVFKIIIWKAVL